MKKLMLILISGLLVLTGGIALGQPYDATGDNQTNDTNATVDVTDTVTMPAETTIEQTEMPVDTTVEETETVIWPTETSKASPGFGWSEAITVTGMLLTMIYVLKRR